jgi:hypothetical protein
MSDASARRHAHAPRTYVKSSVIRGMTTFCAVVRLLRGGDVSGRLARRWRCAHSETARGYRRPLTYVVVIGRIAPSSASGRAAASASSAWSETGEVAK